MTTTTPTPTHPYAAYSSAEWKRQPSTLEVLFGLELPYRAPKSAFGTFVWKWRLWFECTFALSMLQPWEKVLVLTVLNAVILLILVGLFLYFPRHLSFLRGRVLYYLMGSDAVDMSVSDSIHQLFAGWAWNGTLSSFAASSTQEL